VVRELFLACCTERTLVTPFSGRRGGCPLLVGSGGFELWRVSVDADGDADIAEGVNAELTYDTPGDRISALTTLLSGSASTFCSGDDIAVDRL